MHEYGYLSKRANIGNTYVSPNAIVYGESILGTSTLLDSFVIVGYPIRSKIKKLFSRELKEFHYHEFYDQQSSGAILGEKNHIRPFTTIYEKSILENGVQTGTNVLIRENCRIGADSVIGSGSILDSGVTIGKRGSVQSNNFIPPKISIGDDVFLGPNVVFANDKYPASNRLIETNIENDVRIGISSTILPGITIKQGAVVAAGSVVTKDVAEYTVVRGTPARVIMTREEYDKKKKNYEDTER